jgi:D-serine deaminase-like pyridoxal phosphate-dependent protein
MVAAGFDYILIAYPVYGAAKLARLQALREKARILVSLDSTEVAQGLGALGVASGSPVEVYVEVDTGHQRMAERLGRRALSWSPSSPRYPASSSSGCSRTPGTTSLAERDLVVDREFADLLTTHDNCRF